MNTRLRWNTMNGVDLSEANKENIPFPHVYMKKENDMVFPPLPDKSEDIDVVSCDVPSVLATPSSQSSLASTAISPASTGSPSCLVVARDSSDEMDADSEDGETTSRKEKSLGLLCQRFLVAMNEETRSSLTQEVHLETVARKMNVEKRRIYDIVNVMEALDAMSKTNKSFYRWHGLQDLPRLMCELQREAASERLPERVLRVEQAMCSFTELSQRNLSKEAVGSLIEDSHLSEGCSMKTRVDGRDRQGRNSLAQLCRRFLMVLLSNPKNSRRVSLDVASTVLIKDPETEGFEPPSRSRCRRLYDIANVLVALGLIKKVHYLFGTKKIPLFVYCGPEPDENAKYDANACLERMLASTTSAPQTPQMKAATAAMMQSLSLGKRSQSEVDMTSTLQGLTQKMPRMTSEDFVQAASNSLMMFAELAAERLRLESVVRDDFKGSPVAKPSVLKPLPQAPNTVVSLNQATTKPLSAATFQMTTLGLQPFVLPQRTMWASPVVSQVATKSPFQVSNGSNVSSLPKHTVTNILGVSNKTNTPTLDHKNSSPFQVVRKDKAPFGAIQNLPGRF